MPRRAIPEASTRALHGLACSGVFEAHLTVDALADRREAFRALCDDLGVGCVLIELAAGITPSQPMTSSHHRGALATVLDEIESLHTRLEEAGFPVVRVKLEALDTNDGVPVTDDDALAFAGGYFEFHAALVLSESGLEGRLRRLEELCTGHGAHLSRNDRRRTSGGRGDAIVERFVTLRVHGRGRERAASDFAGLLSTLDAASYTVSKVKCEFTIYDSRASLDAGWLPPPPP